MKKIQTFKKKVLMFGVKDKVLLKKRQGLLYKEQVFWKELQGLFTKLSKAQGSKAHLGGI